MIARSETVRELVMNDLVLGVSKNVLAHASAIQLTLTEVITLSPGAEAQFIHRDELLFDAYPFAHPGDRSTDPISLLTSGSSDWSR